MLVALKHRHNGARRLALLVTPTEKDKVAVFIIIACLDVWHADAIGARSTASRLTSRSNRLTVSMKVVTAQAQQIASIKPFESRQKPRPQNDEAVPCQGRQIAGGQRRSALAKFPGPEILCR